MTSAARAIKPRVLVVDTDQSAREFYGRALRIAGYDAITAATVDDAEAASRARRPDAVVFDVRRASGLFGSWLHTSEMSGVAVLMASTTATHVLLAQLAEALSARTPTRKLARVSAPADPNTSGTYARFDVAARR